MGGAKKTGQMRLMKELKAFKAQGVTQKLNASPNPYDDYTEFDDFGAQK